MAAKRGSAEKGSLDAVLPEDVWQLILNRFVDAKDLARLSLVSPSWRRLCSRVPALILRLPDHPSSASALFESILSNKQGLQFLAVFHAQSIEDGLLFKVLWQFSSTIQNIVWDYAYGDIRGAAPQGLWLPHVHTLEIGTIRIRAAQSLVDACPAVRVCKLRVACASEGDLLRFKTPHLEELRVTMTNYSGSDLRVALEGCDQLKRIDLMGKDVEIGGDDLLKLNQLQHCRLLYVTVDLDVEELLLRCPLLQTLEIRTFCTRGLRLPPVLVIKSDSLREFYIDIYQKIQLVLDSSNLMVFKINSGDHKKSVEIRQALTKLHTMELRTCRWGFLSNILATAPNIVNLSLWYNSKDATEEKVMEALNSFHSLKTLKITWSPQKWVSSITHPKFSSSYAQDILEFSRRQEQSTITTKSFQRPTMGECTSC